MATIAKLATQDGQAAVGPATDGAGGEAGAEFTALLSEATGATPPAGTAPVPEAPLVQDEPPQPAEFGIAATGGVLVLPAPVDLRRIPAPDADVPPPAAGLANPRGHLRLGMPPVLPGPVVPPEAESAVMPQAAPDGPAIALPAAASPVAAAVLHALHAVQRPASQAAAAPPGGQAAAGPAPIAEAVARLMDAIEEVAGPDAGAPAGPEGDGALAGASGQPGSAGLAARDAVASAAHPRTLAGTVGTPPWREALGTELRLMIERGVGAATLRLSPEHLGPLEVRIDFADDSAKVWFTASHADTRAALAEALPRLRDMLASVGVNLGEAGVQRDLPGEPGRRDGAWRGSGADGVDAGADARVVVARLDAGRGMVDEYA
jgi:flagellar hook-length control protein FliK